MAAPAMADTARRVALVHDSRRFDGLRAVELGYARALNEAGVPVDLYTCIDPSLAADFAVDGTAVPGRRFPGGGRREMAFNRLFGTFARRLAKVPASPVHVSSVHLASLARYRRDVVVGVPDLAKRTTGFYPWGASWLHNWLLRYLPRAAAVTTYTEWGRQEVARVTGYPIDRIVTVPPALTLPRPDLPPPRPVDPPRREAPWTLLFVAVDRPHKNLELFLRLLAALDDRYRGLYVGRPTEAHASDISRLGLRSRMEVREAVADLLPVYREADLIVFPSRYEGFGLPVLEAMSQGIPVLASTSTCLPEVVGPGGRLLDPEDLEAWRQAVLDLSDPDHHRAAQRAAFDRALEFTPQRTARGLISALSLAGEVAPTSPGAYGTP